MAGVSGVGSENPVYNYDNTNGMQLNTDSSAEELKTQFMTLLVAQLENQDPMNPIENQEFIGQLTQFSALEQLINLNDSVEKIGGIISPPEEEPAETGENT